MPNSTISDIAWSARYLCISQLGQLRRDRAPYFRGFMATRNVLRNEGNCVGSAEVIECDITRKAGTANARDADVCFPKRLWNE